MVEPTGKSVPEEQPQLPKLEIPPSPDESAKEVGKKLKKAAEVGEEVEVAKAKVNPRQAYENLKFVFDYFKNKLGISLDDLYFRKFPGDIVGESTEKGIEIDPIMLMHPGMRLVQAIAHEYAHRKGRIDNEGLVELYVKYVMKIDLAENEGLKMTEKYRKAEENFYEFIVRISDGREIGEVVDEIAELYYSREYEGIYEIYEERYINTRPTKADEKEAYDFFWEVFQEFEWVDTGFTELKPVFEEEEGEEGAEVISLADYRKKIEGKEA